MKNIDWDMQKIQNWNKYRFPLNKESKQLRKVEEEIGEYGMARCRKEKLEELADVYIAFAGLSRFTKIGKFVCKMFEGYEGFDELQDAINAKMAKNIRRKFDENMHHIEPLPVQKKTDRKSVDVSGIVEPEYITITKDFNKWEKENNQWVRVPEPVEYTVVKERYEKGGE